MPKASLTILCTISLLTTTAAIYLLHFEKFVHCQLTANCSNYHHFG